MKQFFNHAFLGAIALTGAVCFSACSSNDDLTEDINPTYDPVANTVKANFSLALTSQLGARTANTRMDEYQTQATGTFRGMKNINLIPFDCIEEITKAKSRVSGSANVLSNVVIGSTENHLNASPGSYNYHYLDVTVPVGTGSFLFYGLSQDAIEPSNTTATAAQKFANGILSTGEANFATGSPEDFHFDLVPINSSTSPDAQCTAIINYLTAIAATNAGTSESPNYWSATEDVTLKDLYDKFVTLPAGSAESVRKTVSHLYQSIYNNTDVMSIAIVNAIKLRATENMTGENKAGTLTFTDDMAEGTNTYPRNINLPDGAAVITWTAGATATAPKVPSAVTAGDRSKAIASLTTYAYPPSLYYFANSLIRVSNSKKDAAYTSKTSWDEILATYDAYGDGANLVKSTTRDIALQKEIQYGVGRMELTVKASDTQSGTDQTASGGPNNSTEKVLWDRKGREVVIPSDGFPITGVLIGTQRNADWNFTPVAANIPEGQSVPDNEFTVYDNAIPSGVAAKKGTPEGVNHTLVIESDANSPVYIAIEMENTSGTSFEGIQGIVPAGAKFYLVATLDPSTGTSPAGKTYSKVFMQDYKTNVNLTINPNTTVDGDGVTYPTGLGAAYNTIPDLGSPTLRIGFSVNLSWEQGLTFNQDL